MPYNLSSPNGILEPCTLDDLTSWFKRELEQVPNAAERDLLLGVASHIDDFTCWPSQAILLWPGCDRVPPPGKRQKYFTYPNYIKEMGKKAKINLDTRQNGPAIASFLLAGGIRPQRFGSLNAWSIHHLYSGKFPYIGRKETVHAAKLSNHFTQSAGLIAAHPIADALVDEFPFFAWLLRAQAFCIFGYNPDGVFASECDAYGFSRACECRVINDKQV